MDVEDPALERADDLGTEQSQVPREDQVIDLGSAEDAEHRSVERRAIGVRRGRDDLERHPVGFGPGERDGRVPVAHHERDPRPDDGIVQERLEVRALAGGEDGDARLGHGATLGTPPRPVNVAARPGAGSHAAPRPRRGRRHRRYAALVPGDERSSRGADRCSVHPAQPQVARCEVCDRAMCLACAIPVRGVTVGQECLALTLGDGAPPPSGPDRPPVDVARWVTFAGFALAVAATLLPWSRFGTGSEPFGAWGDTFRWSLVAGVAAVTGLVLTLLRGRSVWATPALAVTIVSASILAIVDPPAFTSPWLGPWLALGGGVTALVGASIARLRIRRASVARV
jgi:hypothetical protein